MVLVMLMASIAVVSSCTADNPFEEIDETCHCKYLTEVCIETAEVNMAALGLCCFKQAKE